MRLGILSKVLTIALSLFSFTSYAISDKNEPLKVGELRLTSHAATFIAEQQGYFKQHQLNTEFVFFQAAQPVALAIASGDVDVGNTVMTAGLVNLAQKGIVKIIGGSTEESPGVPGMQILASNQAFEKGLTDPTKLNGYTFGITQAGSSFDYIAYKINQVIHQQSALGRKNTLKTIAMHKISNIKAGIASGQIDAGDMLPNLAILMEKNGEAHIIGQVSDYIPNYQVTVLFASTQAIKYRPKQVKAFIEGFKQGAQAFNDTLVTKTASKDATKQVIQSIHQYVYQDKPWEEAEALIAEGAMRIAPKAKINKVSLEDQLNFLKDKKLISQDVTLDQMIDTSFF